jgi:hypothetical protein
MSIDGNRWRREAATLVLALPWKLCYTGVQVSIMANLQAESAGSGVDYDFPPVAELAVGDTTYRVDAGFRGAVAISERAAGSWSWLLVAEGRWDGLSLKAKSLDRAVVLALERALRSALATD